MADELELVETLMEDFGKFKTKSKKDLDDIKAIAEKALTSKELEEKHAEAKTWIDDLNKKVEEINNDIAAKGATVKQLQDELQEFKARRGRVYTPDGQEEETTKNLLKAGFAENFDKIKEQANEPKAEHKFKVKNVGNMTAASNLTGNVVASYASQPALRGRQKVHFRDLVNVIPSATGLWKFYRQNTPVGEGSFDFQTTHAAVKNQLDYDMTEVTVTVDYLAGFVRVAKQMLQDLPFMQSFVSNELVEDYLRTEDLKFFMQVAGAATGNISGVTSTVTVEKIIQAIANLGDSDYDPNGCVVTNQVWAKILLTKPNDYSLPAGNQAVTIAANGDVNILGIPVIKVKDTYIGANRVLLGDWTKAAIIQTEGLNVNMYEQDSDNVQRNLITVKAEARVALAQLRLDAFSYFGAGTT
jgi:HK97 family phage major capsid protein